MELLYLYPPLPLLHLALHEIAREEGEIIAIIPWWPRSGWFPLLLGGQEEGVSPPTKSPSRPTSVTTRASRSHLRSKGLQSPQSRDPPASCPEALGGTLQAAGISRQAACTICNAKRKSTWDLYHPKWQVAEIFSLVRGRRYQSPSGLLDYLDHLTTIPLEHNTFLTHLSALASCSSLLEGNTVGSHPLVATILVVLSFLPRRSELPLGIFFQSWSCWRKGTSNCYAMWS